MVLKFCGRLVAAFLLLLGANSILAADAAPAGDLWQVTSKMSMEGMPMAMPARVSKVCAAKVWTQPPGGNDQQKCTRTNFQMASNTATWTETCESPPMTCQGTITRQGADAYTGSLKFQSPQGNMTINIDGQRLGDCDKPN